ncbi:hypothetical protein [Nocardia australiensis]|uniref:hypothetical protein n=1 Tax=Nocardia australiensis TaxID=2887191 RepID=UPI003558555E
MNPVVVWCELGCYGGSSPLRTQALHPERGPESSSMTRTTCHVAITKNPNRGTFSYNSGTRGVDLNWRTAWNQPGIDAASASSTRSTPRMAPFTGPTCSAPPRPGVTSTRSSRSPRWRNAISRPLSRPTSAERELEHRGGLAGGSALTRRRFGVRLRPGAAFDSLTGLILGLNAFAPRMRSRRS